MVVARGIRQARVEFECLGRVVPERTNSVGQRQDPMRTDRLADLVPVDGGLGREPRRIAGEINRERDERQCVSGGDQVASENP